VLFGTSIKLKITKQFLVNSLCKPSLRFGQVYYLRWEPKNLIYLEFFFNDILGVVCVCFQYLDYDISYKPLLLVNC